MNPNEFGLYMIILPHEARFCTIFGKIFKENEKSQPLWLTLNDLYFALNMDFQRKKPIFAYKTSYFQFGTLKYIDVLTKALLLADKSAMSYYRDLMEKGYFNRLIAGNIIQKVEVDSIRCDFTNYPYQVKTYARQRILRESSVTERSLVTTCQLVNATRSDNNPQGFLIERFNIIENKDLGTYDR